MVEHPVGRESEKPSADACGAGVALGPEPCIETGATHDRVCPDCVTGVRVVQTPATALTGRGA
jgi:hypothetical protein